MEHQHGSSGHSAHSHEHHRHTSHVSEEKKHADHRKAPADHTAHDKHAGHHTENFLKRFWICLVLTVPVLFLSHMIQEWLNVNWRFAGDQYILLALSSIIYFYGGWPFLIGLVREVQDRNLGMMTLVAVAITTAYVYSVAVIFGLKGMDFFWELATLIDIMLLGHWLEMKSQTAASKALESLVALMPTVVHAERNGQVVDISLQELKQEDIAVIKPGEKVPADGVIIEGNSNVNESMLTGESLPVKKEKDAKVVGGSINGDGMLKTKKLPLL